jgi:hypothetical protein
MSSELETIISQAQKLDLPSQIELISHLTKQTQLTAKDSSANPWLAIAGSLVDDPLFDDYVAEIERYRSELDAPQKTIEERRENSAA